MIHSIIILSGLVLFYYYKEYTIGNILILLGLILIKSQNVIKNDKKNDFKIVKERLNKGDIGYMSYSIDKKHIIIRFDDDKIYMFDIDNNIEIEALNYTNLNLDSLYKIDYDRIKYLKKMKNYIADFNVKKGIYRYKFNIYRKLSLNIPESQQHIKYIYLLRIVNDLEYFGILTNRAILIEDINGDYYIYILEQKKLNKISSLNVGLFSVNDDINNLIFQKQLIGIEVKSGLDNFIDFINTSHGIDKINYLFLQIHDSYYYDEKNYDPEPEYIKELELARKLDLEK